MVRADTSSQSQLELLSLVDAFSSQLCGVEGGRHNDLSVFDVLLKLCSLLSSQHMIESQHVNICQRKCLSRAHKPLV